MVDKLIQLNGKSENFDHSAIINGSKNHITIKSTISYIVLNGNDNILNCEDNLCKIGKVVFNGNNNKASFNKINIQYTVKHSNGVNNVFTTFDQNKEIPIQSSVNKTSCILLMNRDLTLLKIKEPNNTLVKTPENTFTNCLTNIGRKIFSGSNNDSNSNLNSRVVNNIMLNSTNQHIAGRRIIDDDLHSSENEASSMVNSNHSYSRSSSVINDEDSESYSDSESEGEADINLIRKEFQSKLIEMDYPQAVTKLKRNKENILDQCVICVESFNEKSKVVLFFCDTHLFHSSCIKKWMNGSTKCPLCKYDYLNDLNQNLSESEA